MAKSPDAFRTISEVAEWLGIQAHVLRFWESKFTQIKPIKRAGGRRYYRPFDMQLLGGIKQLLYEDGLTIKGVQKVLREEGMSHVAALSPALDHATQSQIDATPADPAPTEVGEEEKGVVLNFEPPIAETTSDAPTVTEPAADEPEAEPEAIAPGPIPTDDARETSDRTSQSIAGILYHDLPRSSEEIAPSHEQVAIPASEDNSSEPVAAAPVAPPEPASDPDSGPDSGPDSIAAAAKGPEPDASEDATKEESTQSDQALAETADAAPTVPDKTEAASDKPAPPAALPAFLRRPLEEPVKELVPQTDAPAEAEVNPDPQLGAPPPPPKPRVVDIPAFTSEADFPATPSALAAVYRAKTLPKDTADKIAPLLQQLTALRDGMAARRRNASGPAAKD